MIAVCAAAAACNEGRPIVVSRDPAASSPADPAQIEARSARRCGECHESYLTEWTDSAHADASRSPFYRAMRARAPAPAACDRCHAPLAAALGPADPVAEEGVTCEVCHAIAEVALGPGAASWSLRIADNRKYGPLCDVTEPYFHRVGCSPLHAESRLCAACHHLGHPGAAGTDLRGPSEFEEWQLHEAASPGLHCQGCHMPERRAQVASGGPLRVGVSQHTGGPATGDAVQVEARALAMPGGLRVRGDLRVSGAPHALPVGLPGRELALVAVLRDGEDRLLASDSAVYSRVLVDAAGREVPFFAALRVGADTRLQPNETRPFELRLPAPPPDARVELRLEERPHSAALARALDLQEPLAEVLHVLRFAAPWEPAP